MSENENISRIIIDSETLEVEEIHEYGHLPLLELEDGTEWYVAENSEKAGEAAREYWKDMAENDPEEFTCMVGQENLVKWALGQYAGPGYSQVNSLEDWLDLWLDTPEEQWGSHSGTEEDIDAASPDMVAELGFTPTVAYRHN